MSRVEHTAGLGCGRCGRGGRSGRRGSSSGEFCGSFVGVAEVVKVVDAESESDSQ
jgi:hypothetical protein